MRVFVRVVPSAHGKGGAAGTAGSSDSEGTAGIVGSSDSVGTQDSRCLPVPLVPEGWLCLSFEGRCVSRQRVRLEDGTEAALMLPRGTRLKDGDLLLAEDGWAVLVRAALEELSVADCPDALTQARAAYHLGNRHAAVMLEPGAVKYPADTVLDRMLTGMGMAVSRVREPFQPESGAYDFTAADARAALLSMPPVLVRRGQEGTIPAERP